MTRVVVLLAAPAGYVSVYFGTFGEAVEYVAVWRDKQKQRIETNINAVDTTLYEGHDIDDPSVIVSSVMGQYVIGMYVAKDEPTAADRVATALEKQIGDGDDWKR